MTDVQNLSDVMATAVEIAAPSVARVEARCVSASAVVWSADGVLVTALHAIGRAETLSVGLADGRSVEATVVARDPGTDLAVLRAPASGLVPTTWANEQNVKVGHLALPLGRPGRSVRATLGIVSALGDAVRTATGGRLDRYIEIDGSLPRGFSGGPLVDLHGHALGVNTAGLLRGGATVPASTLTRVVPDLLAHGRVGRGYLGVSVVPTVLPDTVAAQAGAARGVVVVGIERESPAEKGAMHIGDVIVSVDSHSIEAPGDLLSVLEGRVRAEVNIKVVRGGEVRTLTVTTTLRA
jgi:S1-C subfamily serine protease